jgi:hypothetical protein
MKKVRVVIRMPFFFMPIYEPKAHGALYAQVRKRTEKAKVGLRSKSLQFLRAGSLLEK